MRIARNSFLVKKIVTPDVHHYERFKGELKKITWKEIFEKRKQRDKSNLESKRNFLVWENALIKVDKYSSTNILGKKIFNYTVYIKTLKNTIYNDRIVYDIPTGIIPVPENFNLICEYLLKNKTFIKVKSTKNHFNNLIIDFKL